MGIALHVEDTGGSGRPVVLIHGWPMSAQMWDEQVGPFSEAGYRVVTYDRRGFGRSDKPTSGYDYDTLAEDLNGVLTDLDLRDVTLVGFSMGGGEVARYLATYGQQRVHSVVFAAAVPPYLLKSEDNPDGPLPPEGAAEFASSLAADRESFFDGFTRTFFSADGELKVGEEQRQAAIAMCHQSDETAALSCADSFATTDFRDDLPRISVPTLVIHGDSDAIVPLDGSGRRTHVAIIGSELVIVPGAPHGLNLSHTEEFNQALLEFLTR